MHSSCIVVKLDWAAGLPAWLIRRFSSPDLTRKTLFCSQKHQSHSRCDLNEDSLLTLSMNISFWVKPGATTTSKIYRQSLARSCN